MANNQFCRDGTQSVAIQDRSSVTDLTGAPATIAHGGEWNFRVGVDASTGTLVSNGNPFLSNYSKVNGDVVCTQAVTLQEGASVTG